MFSMSDGHLENEGSVSQLRCDNQWWDITKRIYSNTVLMKKDAQ